MERFIIFCGVIFLGLAALSHTVYVVELILNWVAWYLVFGGSKEIYGFVDIHSQSIYEFD